MQRLFPQRMLIRFRRDDCGGALVEFAFVLPILLLMLFGIIGWGMSLSMHNAMYDTARSCARSVAIGAVAAVFYGPELIDAYLGLTAVPL